MFHVLMVITDIVGDGLNISGIIVDLHTKLLHSNRSHKSDSQTQ